MYEYSEELTAKSYRPTWISIWPESAPGTGCLEKPAR